MRQNTFVTLTFYVHHETEKAWGVSKSPHPDEEELAWLPKSRCQIDKDDYSLHDEEVEFIVPEWIVEANDLDSRATHRSDRSAKRDPPKASATHNPKALLTDREYNMLLKCLHPDRRLAVEEVELKLSVQLLMSLKDRLLGKA